MLFTTEKYWLFLAIVFFVYWAVGRRRSLRVVCVLLASYYFYALWNPRLVPLLFALSSIDFLTARGISITTNSRLRRVLLITSLVTDVGTLFVFKYFNFFSSSTNALLERLHWQTRSFLIEDLVIPLGLSFITFRSLSYVIDVYRKTIPATNRYLDYLAFVAFFPTLIAGPVVRAKDLLPQFSRLEVNNDQGVEAILLILVGLIKKVAIADMIGSNLVDRVFDQPQFYSSLETLAAIYGYALQIYCDFSGYSDIAIGSAMLLGFKLPDNFNSPYRAQNLRDFWRRWHITLSSWLFDYVYISIGGLRKRRFNLYRNLFLTFLIGGLWHGASWTFVVWGALHGLGLALNQWWSTRFKRRVRVWWLKVLCTIATFNFICLTWIVFRSQTLSQAVEVLKRLSVFQFSTANLPTSLLLLLVVGFASHFAPAKFVMRVRDGWAWLPAPAQALIVLSVAAGLYYVSGAEVQFIYGNF
ncbi:MAG TPA: MBOAT family protein [Pyrinomonadaceae bacterium]|nr:MBOAT family protein [Pyrinomonadaceae bacterium]